MCPLLSNLISRSERLELSQGRKKNFILFCFVLRAWQHVKRSQFDNTRCIASAAKLCAHLSPHNSISPTSIGRITSRFHYFLRFPWHFGLPGKTIYCHAVSFSCALSIYIYTTEDPGRQRFLRPHRGWRKIAPVRYVSVRRRCGAAPDILLFRVCVLSICCLCALHRSINIYMYILYMYTRNRFSMVLAAQSLAAGGQRCRLIFLCDTLESAQHRKKEYMDGNKPRAFYGITHQGERAILLDG